jgi:hypothetical protein
VLRHGLIAGLASLTLATSALAQRQIEIPGIGTIFFNLGEQRTTQERREIDSNYRVIDRQRNVSDSNRIVFDVGVRKGNFTQLRIRAVDKIARITGVQIVFGNGRAQDVDFYEPLMPGELTPAFDLAGDARKIKQVIVNKRRDWRRGRGHLELLGLPDQAGDYKVVETERSGRGDDEIVFDLSRGDGRWDSIRFRALDTRVPIDRAIIVFGNGDRQRVNFDSVLRPGEVSKQINLAGRNSRFLKKVELRLKRQKWRRGRVQLLGKKQRGRAVAADRVQHKIPEGWVLFGSQTVKGFGDRDSIKVGADAGEFESIAFRALQNDIYLREITIVYGNGRKDKRTINLIVPKGHGTKVIDLKGKGRVIRRIDFLYQPANKGLRRSARLQAYGQYSRDWLRGTRGGTRGQKWIMLGAQEAHMFSTDNDTFVVGERMGKFKGIRVAAQDNSVRLYGMEIIYGNGTSETVPIYGKLGAGQSTQVFDLKGRNRFIDRINLRYRTSFSLAGQGTVQVWGQR